MSVPSVWVVSLCVCLCDRSADVVGGDGRIYGTRIWFNMFEDMLLKYAWSTIGLLAQAVPVFWPDAVLLMDATRTLREGESVAARTEKYITNRRSVARARVPHAHQAAD